MGYVLYDATMDEECRECKILPLCMGNALKIEWETKLTDALNIYMY